MQDQLLDNASKIRTLKMKTFFKTSTLRHGMTYIRCSAGSCVQFLNDAAYALNNYSFFLYSHVGFFSFLISFYLHEKTKSCNLYLAFCRLLWAFNSCM